MNDFLHVLAFLFIILTFFGCIIAGISIDNYWEGKRTVYDKCIEKCPIANYDWINLDCPTYCEKFLICEGKNGR